MAFHFERPPGFDLERHWDEVCANFGSNLPEYQARLRVRHGAVARLRWSTHVLEMTPARRGGWRDALIDTENEQEAISLVLSLAPDVIVREPDSLASACRDAALTHVRLAAPIPVARLESC